MPPPTGAVREDTLRDLESKIGGAAATDEAELFVAAAGLAKYAGFAHLLNARAYADAAIAFHRWALPAHGFQFGATHRTGGLASSWRRGDAHALPFEAATPGLALLRATLAAIGNPGFADCTHCNGLGWIVARDGARRMCRHGV
jgi:hypothetical protein